MILILGVYTISTWMKLNETESYGGIIGKGNGGGETNYSFLLWFPETSWGVDGSYQKLFFSLNGISHGGLDARHIFGNAYDMPLNEWHYITVTVNNNSKSAKLYINGDLFSERNFDGQSTNINNSSLQIGTYASGNYSFNGNIASVEIWNEDLIDEDIQWNMANTNYIDSDDSRLVGYWNFNEGQEDTINDLSVNENNGYIHW